MTAVRDNNVQTQKSLMPNDQIFWRLSNNVDDNDWECLKIVRN